VPVEVQIKAPFKKLESSCYASRRKIHPKLLNDDLDFENMNDFTLASDSPDPCPTKEEFTKTNSQIPEEGINFTTTKSGKSKVYHHEGYNYTKSSKNISGSLVFLRCQLYCSHKRAKCSGTAQINVGKKCIYAKAPHSHEPNDKSSKIQIFFKRVRNECEKLPIQLHKFKFEEMAEDFCRIEGIEREEINFSMVESSCYTRARKHVPSEDPKLFEDMQETIDKYKDKVVEERVKRTSKLCPICGKNLKYGLKDHIERVHEGKRSHMCSICGGSFKRDADLRGHIKGVHEKLKPYKCTLCDSSFLQSNALKSHTEAVHEGKKPFKCSLCDLAFGFKGGLKMHIVTVHEKKKPFKCSKCEFRTTQRTHLKCHFDSVHEGIKPHKCTICDAAFGLVGSLRRHIHSVHEKKRPYLCPDCGLGFAENNLLKKHILAVHKKEKPFSCIKCSARFSRKDKLKTHITTVHEGIKPNSKASHK
jgi:hypothetical protein